MKIDVKGIKAQQADALHKYVDAQASKQHAIKTMSGYAAALSINGKARTAYVTLQTTVQKAIGQLAEEDAVAKQTMLNPMLTDPSWYAWLSGIQQDATVHDVELGSMRNQLTASMLAYAQAQFAPADKQKVASAPTPEAAAAAVDAAKKSPANKPPLSNANNPNTQTPGSQSSSDPVADAPPVEDEMSAGAKVGIAAAAGLALLWIARKVM